MEKSANFLKKKSKGVKFGKYTVAGLLFTAFQERLIYNGSNKCSWNPQAYDQGLL